MYQKSHRITFIFIPIIICWMLSCKSNSKSYPCPAYHTPKGMFDSTGNMTGGYNVKKNQKSGLMEKKKNKSLRDRKRAG